MADGSKIPGRECSQFLVSIHHLEFHGIKRITRIDRKLGVSLFLFFRRENWTLRYFFLHSSDMYPRKPRERLVNVAISINDEEIPETFLISLLNGVVQAAEDFPVPAAFYLHDFAVRILPIKELSNQSRIRGSLRSPCLWRARTAKSPELFVSYFLKRVVSIFQEDDTAPSSWLLDRLLLP